MLKRVVSVIKFIAEHGLEFRENELIGSPRNGNFLGILELIAQHATFLHSISKLKLIATALICRSITKHTRVICLTRVCMVRAESRKTPRSLIDEGGEIQSFPRSIGADGHM